MEACNQARQSYLDTFGKGALMLPKIALVSVYSSDHVQYDMFVDILYNLLEERKPEESISHKEMPTKIRHEEFVSRKPYEAWYIIQAMGEKDYPFVGAIYLSKDKEIGISIFNDYRRHHYASAAINALIKEHPKSHYFANINPNNYKSEELFKRHGFKYHKSLNSRRNVDGKSFYGTIQKTYIKIIDDEV